MPIHTVPFTTDCVNLGARNSKEGAKPSPSRTRLTNNVNFLKSEWIKFDYEDPADQLRHPDWKTPEEWRKYVSQVHEYVGNGTPDLTDNYPFRKYNLIASSNPDGFPILRTSPLTGNDLLVDIKKRQGFNAWKVGHGLRIVRRGRNALAPNSQQEKEIKRALKTYSHTVRKSVFAMSGQQVQGFIERQMPGISEVTQRQIFDAWGDWLFRIACRDPTRGLTRNWLESGGTRIPQDTEDDEVGSMALIPCAAMRRTWSEVSLEALESYYKGKNWDQ